MLEVGNREFGEAVVSRLTETQKTWNTIDILLSRISALFAIDITKELLVLEVKRRACKSKRINLSSGISLRASQRRKLANVGQADRSTERTFKV